MAGKTKRVGGGVRVEGAGGERGGGRGKEKEELKKVSERGEA